MQADLDAFGNSLCRLRGARSSVRLRPPPLGAPACWQRCPDRFARRRRGKGADSRESWWRLSDRCRWKRAIAQPVG
jgi:hypothetical protein